MFLKIPPPLLMFIALFIMYASTYFLPLWQFKRLWIIIIPLTIAAVGIGLLSVLALAKAKTTINPFIPQKTQRLVTSGMYQYSRNPMYLSLLLVLIAAVFIYGELSTILGVIAFIFVVNYFQIKPEEKVLERLFGDEYKYYCHRVRRWL